MPATEVAASRSPNLSMTALVATATATALQGSSYAAAFLSSPSSASRLNGVSSSGNGPSQLSLAASMPFPQATQSSAMVVGISGIVAATVAAASRTERRRRVAMRAEDDFQFVTPEEWCDRVKRIEGDRALFDVTIPKPLGLVPANFPTRPGVGVAKITPDGNTDILNRKVWLEDAPGMWVLEGDEVVAVNGVSVEGESLDKVGPLVKDSEGDSITLTLVRYYKAGPVKVVFLPSQKVATMKRGIEISSAAKVGVEEVSFSCEEGWCKTCWHTDPMWGTVYRACSAVSRKRPPPKNPRVIPEGWDNVMPMYLLNWSASKKWARQKKQEREQAQLEQSQKEMA